VKEKQHQCKYAATIGVARSLCLGADNQDAKGVDEERVWGGAVPSQTD